MSNFINGLLKNMANKGRYGDNNLRFVDGKLSHVNPQEASAIDNYGFMGENYTKSIGAGTINPNTGLKEYHPGSNYYNFYERHYHELQDDGTYTKKDIRAGHPNFSDAYYAEQTHYEGSGTKDLQTADYSTMTPTETGEEDVTGFTYDTLQADPEAFDLREIQKYYDRETGEIADSEGLVAYLRTVNPEFRKMAYMGAGYHHDKGFEGSGQSTYKQRVDSEGNPYYAISDSDIIKEWILKGIDPFAGEGKIADRTSQLTSDIASERAAAKEARIALETGARQFTPYGAQQKAISDKLKTSAEDVYKIYGEDIYDINKETGEDIYGFLTDLTDKEEGAFYQGGATPYASAYK